MSRNRRSPHHATAPTPAVVAPVPPQCAVPVADAPPAANWGAHERPRECHRCHSAEARVLRTTHHLYPPRTCRVRKCVCGQRYTTVELIPAHSGTP